MGRSSVTVIGIDHDSPEGASSTVAVIVSDPPSATPPRINTPSTTVPSPENRTAFSSSATATVAEPAVDEGT